MSESAWRRVPGLLRLRERRRSRWITALICLVVGLMISIGSLNARGYDLRPGRNTELVDLIREGTRRNAELARTVDSLRRDVDERAAQAGAQPDQSERLAAVGSVAGLEGVAGPGVTVVLTDAPASVHIPGIDEDLLVVHQQDIQAVVNAFWAAGAEAMTIQGQRVISTTGIKCVGNSVVLHGTPYTPPYAITAIGNPDRLAEGLAASAHVRAYRQHVEAYRLGYQQRREPNVKLPAYQGSVGFQYARPA